MDPITFGAATNLFIKILVASFGLLVISYFTRGRNKRLGIYLEELFNREEAWSENEKAQFIYSCISLCCATAVVCAAIT